ncbi:leucine-rich_repeat domain-containing protein [Hexamita inflata]|uniref:Leucine-rich repeat domain-containing protein n=1 Tax=Hexamita inflata TaxID=28002 RepID=A0AA86UGL5_9EUKA|nr:leucine-rich repeat domain-containing protein [Hexamita inflata]
MRLDHSISLKFVEQINVKRLLIRWSPPVNLTRVPDLRFLDIHDCQQTDLSGIGQMVNLNRLYLSRNCICNIFELRLLTNLTELNLAHNKIKDLSVLQLLTNLKKLDVSFNCVTDVYCLNKLISLLYLNLTANKIVCVSPLSCLIHLEQLDLVSNSIVNFRGDLFQISNIKLKDNYLAHATVNGKDIKITYPRDPTIQMQLIANKMEVIFNQTERLKLKSVMKRNIMKFQKEISKFINKCLKQQEQLSISLVSLITNETMNINNQ